MIQSGQVLNVDAMITEISKDLPILTTKITNFVINFNRTEYRQHVKVMFGSLVPKAQTQKLAQQLKDLSLIFLTQLERNHISFLQVLEKIIRKENKNKYVMMQASHKRASRSQFEGTRSFSVSSLNFDKKSQNESLTELQSTVLLPASKLQMQPEHVKYQIQSFQQFKQSGLHEEKVVRRLLKWQYYCKKAIQQLDSLKANHMPEIEAKLRIVLRLRQKRDLIATKYLPEIEALRFQKLVVAVQMQKQQMDQNLVQFRSGFVTKKLIMFQTILDLSLKDIRSEQKVMFDRYTKLVKLDQYCDCLFFAIDVKRRCSINRYFLHKQELDLFPIQQMNVKPLILKITYFKFSIKFTQFRAMRANLAIFKLRSLQQAMNRKKITIVQLKSKKMIQAAAHGIGMGDRKVIAPVHHNLRQIQLQTYELKRLIKESRDEMPRKLKQIQLLRVKKQGHLDAVARKMVKKRWILQEAVDFIPKRMAIVKLMMLQKRLISLQCFSIQCKCRRYYGFKYAELKRSVRLLVQSAQMHLNFSLCVRQNVLRMHYNRNVHLRLSVERHLLVLQVQKQIFVQKQNILLRLQHKQPAKELTPQLRLKRLQKVDSLKLVGALNVAQPKLSQNVQDTIVRDEPSMNDNRQTGLSRLKASFTMLAERDKEVLDSRKRKFTESQRTLNDIERRESDAVIAKQQTDVVKKVLPSKIAFPDQKFDLVVHIQRNVPKLVEQLPIACAQQLMKYIDDTTALEMIMKQNIEQLKGLLSNMEWRQRFAEFQQFQDFFEFFQSKEMQCQDVTFIYLQLLIIGAELGDSQFPQVKYRGEEIFGGM